MAVLYTLEIELWLILLYWTLNTVLDANNELFGKALLQFVVKS